MLTLQRQAPGRVAAGASVTVHWYKANADPTTPGAWQSSWLGTSY